jgi:peptide/nickel transport system ATP-binding protein
MTAPPARDDDVVLEVDGLRVELENGKPVVDGVSMTLRRGEILGVVGESGSGKTTTALALLGYAAPGLRIVAGSATVAGTPVAIEGGERVRSVRGEMISYLPQNPGAALDPSQRIGRAIAAMFREHRGASMPAEARSASVAAVGLPGTAEFLRRFPHQLSGGQQQRVSTAIALVCEPPVVVLDEPTTGLDVITQARILEEIKRLRDELGIAMVYVTHDISVIANVADRIAVMYAGSIVEEGPTARVLSRPEHPYTLGLLESIPDHLSPRIVQALPGIAVAVGERPVGCAFAPRCAQVRPRCTAEAPELVAVEPGRAVRCYEASRTPQRTTAPPLGARPAPGDERKAEPLLEVRALRAEYAGRGETVVAAEDVSFDVTRGQIVALVGESGSGKTTIARTIAGLHPIAGGEARLLGAPLPSLAKRRTSEQRRQVQIIFQNSADALNPREVIRTAIARPAQHLRGLGRAEAHAEADELLEHVRLTRQVGGRYPAELSGGERQRVAIARALAGHPELLICDEITSSLDVSVQAAVLTLLGDLRAELDVGLLFITHDLGVVASFADDVLVLSDGRVCEHGPVAQVISAPAHPYTSRLLESAPSISAALGALAP